MDTYESIGDDFQMLVEDEFESFIASPQIETMVLCEEHVYDEWNCLLME